MMESGRTITIDTRDFGKQEIGISDIITFPNGIIAFGEFTEYALLSPLGEGKYPMWLQSVQKPQLCFTVFDPEQLCDGYSPEITAEDLSVIEAEDKNDLLLLAIAVVPDDYRNATVNLKGPIAVNTVNKKAVQIIAAENYPLKFPIYKKEGE